LREGLLAYLELLKSDATIEFRHAQLLYAAGALKESPKLPEILRDG